ncbi:MAG TPA: TraG family conjugative transposon ATPase [Puia sp.]|uniref:TraG family conjugative transposon ATPase n=1 Tax=Puia sp. TaxID=2045100 RepID=UPI002B8EB43A|nr:TraG family conjugative transposon ATPase [Puia sp.]HVU95490.1 TraG family conjugative transposon ATPase [Puia sp.]
MKTVQLEQILPFREIDQDCIVSRKGDVSIIFELFKSPIFTLFQSEMGLLHEALAKGIGCFSDGVTVHFQEWFTGVRYELPPAYRDKGSTTAADNHLLTTTADNHFLTAASDRKFEGRKHQRHRSFLAVARRAERGRPSTSALSTLVRPTLVPGELLDKCTQEAFLASCRQLADILESTGLVKVRQLAGEELAGGPDTTGIIEQYMTLDPEHLQPTLTDIAIHNGNIRVGRKQVILYTLADAGNLPAQCAPSCRYEPYSTPVTELPVGFATHLGPLLDIDHVYNLFIVKDDPRPELKKLETRLRRLKSLAGASRENGVTAAETEAYLNQAAQPGQVPVRVHVNVMAWSEDPTAVTSVSNRLSTAIGRTGATPHLETEGAPQIWWAGIPGNAGDLPMNETFASFLNPALCWFLPESSNPDASAPTGIRLGDRFTGVPVNVDLSDEPMRKGKTANRNKFILSPSGSGKSYKMNHMLRSYHAQGAHSVVLDMGGSYKSLCRLLDGQYFECTEKDPIQFNPFLLPPGETPDTEKKESLKALLLTLFKKTEEGFTRKEYVTVSNMLDGYFRWQTQNPGCFPCFDSFYEWLQDEFLPRLEEDGMRESDVDGKGLLYVLRPYYKGGEFQYLLNARENADLFHQRLIVFDLDSIKDHPILFPVTTLIIMELFISKMRKLKGIRKVIVLEEAWKAIAKEGMSEYIKYLFKTVRKFYGEAIVVTQDIEDIVSSPVVKNSIINNADCKILLDQSKFMNRFDQIQELLGLTENDKALILSLNKANDPDKKYKEVFIALGATERKVYRLEVSLEEHLAYTTEPSERVRVEEYAEKQGGILQGIQALAADIRSGAVKWLLALVFTTGFLLAPQRRASAQILDIIDDAIKAALEEADLRLQRLKAATLWLQNTQKAAENSMAGELLDDITGWVRQQDDLYHAYYDELWQVKSVLTGYSRVKSLIDRQVQLVRAYQQATAAIRADPHLSAAEAAQMLDVCKGILDASIQNAERLTTVVTGYATQMDDAGRLQTIDETDAAIDRDYAALRSYTQQARLVSLQRAKDQADVQTIRALYGIH